MPKQSQEKKKRKVQSQTFSDAEIISIFLRGKDKQLASARLRIKTVKTGLSNLLYHSVGNPIEYLFCQLGSIQRQGEGIKKLLLIEPKHGSPDLIRVVFGGFNANEIYWFYKMTPLTIDEALSIYREANNAGTIFDTQSTADQGGEVVL